MQREEKSVMQENLVELRMGSFKTIVFLTAVVGWVWFTWSAWPQDGYTLFRSSTWAVSGVLLVVALLSYVLATRNLLLASDLFISGLMVVITGTVMIFKSADMGYLYVIPIAFSGVLLSQSGLVFITGLVGALSLSVGVVEPNLRPADFLIPLMVIGLATVAIIISTNNLHKALAWALTSYQEAHKNELIARENKVNLERVLKSLDTTMAKLQRTNVTLTQTRNQAEEARRLKQQFAQTISHELRTPLNLIVGFTETMIKSPEYYGDPLSPAYMRDLSVVYRNACHLQNLVNDVLDLARLEAAYLSLELEEIDLIEVIEDAVQTIRGLVEGRGLTLQTELVADLPHVWGDAVRLKQVLLNLLNNAARFTKQGSVTVRAFARDQEVIIAVSDTGMGIPAENATEIFEAFRQLENPMQRRTDGAGLGLAICKQLIDLHGGNIWVESEVGVGSTFFFSLPVGRIETISIESKALETGTAALPAAAMPSSPQRVAMLVTRSPSAAALVSRSLTSYRTVVVSELQQAWLAAQQLMPQAILVDTEAEEFDQARLRHFVETLNLPRALVVTCPLPGEEPLRKRLAVDSYLIKPVSREGLWDVLRQFSENLNRVLVVDHDQDFVRLISRMLASPVRQYQVTHAYSGQEALEMARRSRPEIMLLDLNLPDTNGIRVIQAIRADPALKRMRIVVVTAYEEVDSSNLLAGLICVAKTPGLTAVEVMNWIQCALGDCS
jgi:signal transduction histidine kinase/CheY-like chemotaxis protein